MGKKLTIMKIKILIIILLFSLGCFEELPEITRISLTETTTNDEIKWSDSNLNDVVFEWTIETDVQATELTFYTEGREILTIIPKENKILFNKKFTQDENAMAFLSVLQELLKTPDWNLCE